MVDLWLVLEAHWNWVLVLILLVALGIVTKVRD